MEVDGLLGWDLNRKLGWAGRQFALSQLGSIICFDPGSGIDFLPAS
jgi:hypothetical protein